MNKKDSILLGPSSYLEKKAEEALKEIKQKEKSNIELDADDKITNSKSKIEDSITDPVISFKNFLTQNRWNRAYLIISATAIIIQFIAFKILYPFAGFIADDSYAYLKGALLNLDINTYPIGYSKFLRIFSTFSTSDIALVGFQYIFIQYAGLFFLFTLFYFFKPGNLVTLILLAFFVLNPLFLFVSNYVSSDAFFIGLSFLWMTQLLWIIHKPTLFQMATHAFLLLALFTVRYNALFYPCITAISFILTRQRILPKIAGITFCIIAVGSFIYSTSQKYHSLTGTYQFSPFSGWQLSNNALYMYRNVYDNYDNNIPTKFMQLDKSVRNYFDTVKHSKYPSAETQLAGFPGPNTFYQWSSTSPLMIYMFEHFKNNNATSKFQKWAAVAPLYSQYGYYLIKKHPASFTKYYLWPNLISFYTPDLEFLEKYNMGIDTVQLIAQNWFGYKSNKVHCVFKNLNVDLLIFYPPLMAIINSTFIISVICFLLTWNFKQYSFFSGILTTVICFWLANFGFSIFASPPRLRFQIFPMFLALSFSILLIELIYLKRND